MANLLATLPTSVWNPPTTTTTPQVAPTAAPAVTAVAAPKVVAPVATTPIKTATVAPTAPTGGIDYTLHQGVSIAAYNARIAAANPNLPAPGTTSPTGITNTAAAAGTPVAQMPQVTQQLPPIQSTPQNFTVDTHAMTPSSTMGQNVTSNDVQNLYQQYAQKVAAAQQYSPEYLAAVKGSQGVQTRDAQLQENLISGQGFAGATADYAAGVTNRARSQNAIEGLQYTQAQQVQELIRQGNIAGATALLNAAKPESVSPGSSLVSPMTGQPAYGGMSGYQDIQNRQTYANLQQSYPDAQIPAYNESLSTSQNLQAAQQLTAQAPSFQARQTISVPLPGGGYALVNKNQIAQNSSGSTVLISPAQAALVNAAGANIKDISSQQANTRLAVQTADLNFPLLINAVQKAGVNDFNAPLGNQMQKAYNDRLIGSGDYAAYNTLLTSLQTEYSAIIGRKGSVTNMTRSEAESLVSGTLGLTALKSVYSTLQKESANVLTSYQDEINKQTQSMQGIYDQGQSLGSSTPGGSTTSGSTDDPMGFFTK